jgi:hypothetical protein
VSSLTREGLARIDLAFARVIEHYLRATVASDAAVPKMTTILIKILFPATLLTAAVRLVLTINRLSVAAKWFEGSKVLFEMLVDLAVLLSLNLLNY